MMELGPCRISFLKFVLSHWALPVITIGRETDNMVVLNHPLVSRYHARLVQVQGGYRIIDNKSTNGIYVNDDLAPVKDQPLKLGDEIHIGPFKLIYTGTELTQQDESKSIRIDALHLQKVGNKNAILINDISIAIPPRKFVSVVGAPRPGHSILMDSPNALP